MQNPTFQPNDEAAENAPHYLDQWIESRDHVNQWDVSVLMVQTQTNTYDSDEVE